MAPPENVRGETGVHPRGSVYCALGYLSTWSATQRAKCGICRFRKERVLAQHYGDPLSIIVWSDLPASTTAGPPPPSAWMKLSTCVFKSREEYRNEHTDPVLTQPQTVRHAALPPRVWHGSNALPSPPPPLDVIPQHQRLRVGMQSHLLLHPVGQRVAVHELEQPVLEQRQRYVQRHQPLTVVLDEVQKLQPTGGRPCPRWRGEA